MLRIQYILTTRYKGFIIIYISCAFFHVYLRDDAMQGCTFTFHEVVQRLQKAAACQKAFLINPSVGVRSLTCRRRRHVIPVEFISFAFTNVCSSHTARSHQWILQDERRQRY